jgi:hypothetical protein
MYYTSVQSRVEFKRVNNQILFSPESQIGMEIIAEMSQSQSRSPSEFSIPNVSAPTIPKSAAENAKEAAGTESEQPENIGDSQQENYAAKAIQDKERIHAAEPSGPSSAHSDSNEVISDSEHSAKDDDDHASKETVTRSRTATMLKSIFHSHHGKHEDAHAGSGHLHHSLLAKLFHLHHTKAEQEGSDEQSLAGDIGKIKQSPSAAQLNSDAKDSSAPPKSPIESPVDRRDEEDVLDTRHEHGFHFFSRGRKTVHHSPTTEKKVMDSDKDDRAQESPSPIRNESAVAETPHLKKHKFSFPKFGGDHKSGADSPFERRSTSVIEPTLTEKYGKAIEILGKGACGTVRLVHYLMQVKRTDNQGEWYAVKEFRKRHHGETEKDYEKKLISEFCIRCTS